MLRMMFSHSSIPSCSSPSAQTYVIVATFHPSLAYHYDHPQELEEYLRRSERAIEEIEAAKAEYLRRKARP